MSRHKNNETEPRNRSAQRWRKQIRREMLKPAVIKTHPLPWHWDHGVLYDKYSKEITRESPFAEGRAANPAPSPRKHVATSPDHHRSSYFPGNRPWDY